MTALVWWLKSNWPVLMFIVAVAVMFSWPVLTRLPNTGIWDWSEAVAHYAAADFTIFKYGQFPFWNPYICGGAPALANPQTYWLSLTGVMALLTDPVTGPKLAIPLYLILGGIGMFLWVRLMGASRLGAALAMPIFLASGFMATHLAAGQFLWLNLAWVPWIFWGYVKSRKKWWYLVVGAAFLTMIGLEGRSYLVAYVAIALIVYGLARDILSHWRERAIVRAVLLLMIAFGLGAWKFIPDLFFLSLATSHLGESSFVPLRLLPDMFLLNDVRPNAPYDFEYLRAHNSLPWFEFGYYLGVVPLALAALGLARKKMWPKLAAPLAVLLVFFYIVFTDPAVSLLERLPIVSELRNQQRAASIMILMVALLAALGLDAVGRWRSRRLKNIAPIARAALLGFVVIDLLIVTSAALAQGYGTEIVGDRVPPPVLPVFEQGRGSNDPWPIVQQNKGAADFCPAILVAWYNDREVAPKEDADKYRGEVYLDGPGVINEYEITPNIIKAQLQTPVATRLIVNQNANPGWVSNVGQVDGGEKLITVDIPKGRHDLELRYTPPGIGYGLLVFITTLAALGGARLIEKKRAKTS